MSLEPAEDLTKETSLFQIFKQCHIYFFDKFNLTITFIVYALMLAYLFHGNITHASYVEKIRSIADDGLSFVGSILGFLIAGFTIFATFSDKNLFVAMAIKKHPKYNLSYLKYTFFAFMYVFIVYLLFGTACLLVKLLSDEGYIGSEIVKSATENFPLQRRHISGLVHATLGAGFFYLFVILKAFIFNVYHVVVARIRWEVKDSQSEAAE